MQEKTIPTEKMSRIKEKKLLKYLPYTCVVLCGLFDVSSLHNPHPNNPCISTER